MAPSENETPSRPVRRPCRSSRRRAIGQIDEQRCQPVVQVLAKFSVAHGPLEVDVRRGDDAHVDRVARSGTDGPDLSLLQDAKQSHLRLRRHVADLVEEEDSAVRGVEQARMPSVRARKGTTLVAEQLALDERVGDGAAVDRDERAIPARAPRVQRARDELLTGPALARDERR